MARIKQEDIDALRDRADLVEVVSGYTTLKKSGTNSFKGLCPFHSERTPSFTVNAASGLFHCFGCQKGGDVYTFVEEIENLPFAEAAEWLARRFGYDLTYEEMRPGEARAAGQKLRIYRANEAAMEFWHRTLMESDSATEARRYLGSRGFDRGVAERWKLGFAPGRDSTCRHLIERGFSREDILAADLGRRSERDGSLYDSFRRRITFPTWNLQGDVAGFGARALGDEQPKYLNTSETPAFSKSRLMYGLNRAKSAISRGVAVVVEGYTDVIALHEAGITEAVATNGVALGESHFELLKKFTDRVVLMFDSDAAGSSATERGFGLHRRIGLEVLVAPLPPGEDPADVVAGGGADGARRLIGQAKPLVEFMLRATVDRLPLDTPEARSRAVREAVKVLGWHPDPIARHEYAFTVARMVGVEPEAVHRALGEMTSGGRDTGGGSDDTGRDRRLPGHVKLEREVLQLLLHDSDASRWIGELDESDFTARARRELFAGIAAATAKGETLARPVVAGSMSDDALSLYTELAVEAPARPVEDGERFAREAFLRIKIFSLDRDIKERRNVLQAINPLEEPQRHDELFTELVGLEARRRDLLKRLQEAA